MSSATLSHAESSEHHGAPPAVAKFGMIVFLVSEAMLFGGLIAGYIVLRLSHGEAWPPPGAIDIGLTMPPSVLNWVMIVNTLILISSSFAFHAVENAVKKGKSGLFWLLLTIVLGVTFLSVQAWEWNHLRHEGMWFDTFGVYGSCFFVLTGFHGVHVCIGVLLITWCFLRQLCFRSFTPARHVALDNVGLYWHFVDVVWVFLYVILYVI